MPFACVGATGDPANDLPSDDSTAIPDTDCDLCGSRLPLAASLQGWPLAGVPALIRARGDAARPNIVLVVVDALRADHVSANGYARGVTPNLDGMIAANGVTFRQTITASPGPFPPTWRS